MPECPSCSVNFKQVAPLEPRTDEGYESNKANNTHSYYDDANGDQTCAVLNSSGEDEWGNQREIGDGKE